LIHTLPCFAHWLINGRSSHHFQQRSHHILRPLKNMRSSHCTLSKNYFHT
jgi:hypothetical protein